MKLCRFCDDWGQCTSKCRSSRIEQKDITQKVIQMSLCDISQASALTGSLDAQSISGSVWFFLEQGEG